MTDREEFEAALHRYEALRTRSEAVSPRMIRSFWLFVVGGVAGLAVGGPAGGAIGLFLGGFATIGVVLVLFAYGMRLLDRKRAAFDVALELTERQRDPLVALRWLQEIRP